MPQNRPRTYLIGFDKAKYGENINKLSFKSLPKKRNMPSIHKSLNDIINLKEDKDFYLSQRYFPKNAN